MRTDTMRGPSALLALRAGLCFGAAGLLVGALLGVGATPVAVDVVQAPWDKLVHLYAYAVLGLLLGAGFSGRRPLLAAGLAFAVGVIDEAMQTFHPGRHADLADLGADLCGVTLAATILWFVRRRYG